MNHPANRPPPNRATSRPPVTIDEHTGKTVDELLSIARSGSERWKDGLDWLVDN